MYGTKAALFQFYQNSTAQTAECAKKALKTDITTLKVARYYSLIFGTASLVILGTIIAVSKGEEDKKEGAIIPIIGALAAIVFLCSTCFYLFSLPLQWITQFHMRKIEKFENLSSF